MTATDRQPLSEQVAEQAADWFVRLSSAEPSEADWRAFGDWLEASPDHAEAYDRLERLSLELDGHREQAAAAGPTVVAFRPRPRPLARFWIPLGAAAAASLVLAVFGIRQVYPPAPAPVTYATARGETRTLALEDGSHIVLNTASRLTVSFERKARWVALAEGEATFDVAHDEARPFLISVGDREVRVVGTEFDILRLPSRTAVTVRRGIVSVRPVAGGDAVRLVKGQQLVQSDGAGAPVLRTVDPEETFAWRSGRVIYRDRPLSEVAEDLSRYFATPIRVGDPQSGALLFSGVLVIDSEESVVRRLQEFTPLRADRTGGAIVLRRAAR